MRKSVMSIEMYCTKCGSYNENGSRFCSSCGQPLDGAMTGSFNRAQVSQKSMGIAILLSLFIPGAGQMYTEKVARGLIVLVLSAVFLITYILAIVSLVLWIYSLVDSYNLVKSWNEQLDRDPYTRPW